MNSLARAKTNILVRGILDGRFVYSDIKLEEYKGYVIEVLLEKIQDGMDVELIPCQETKELITGKIKNQ